MDYPDTLAAFRHYMQWTQQQMANYLEVPVGSYKNYESKASATRHTIRFLATRLHVSADWLLGIASEMWNEQVRMLRRALYQEIYQLQQADGEAAVFALFDDRITWVLRWLLRQEICPLNLQFLSGLLLVSEETVERWVERPYGSNDPTLLPPGRISVQRLAHFTGISETAYFKAMILPRVDWDVWAPVVCELEVNGRTPHDVLSNMDGVLRVTQPVVPQRIR